MEEFDRKQHWENIYQTKQSGEVSWFQQTPVISLEFVKYFNIPKTAKIIDVGGGDSLFVDHLTDLIGCRIDNQGKKTSSNFY